MKIKCLSLAILFACIPLVGCSLAVPEAEETNKEEPLKEEFTDMCAGLMVVLYTDGEEGFEELTSTAFGDESCVALWLDYTAGEYGFFASGSSGDDYLFAGNINENTADSGATCSASGTVYLNAGLLDEHFVSLDTLSRDENGDMARDNASTLWKMGSIVEHSSTAESKQEIKKTELLNGEMTETVKTLTLRITLTVKMQEVGTDWRILQYGEDGELLCVTSVSETSEQSFPLAESCAFLVGEETVAGEKKRTIYEKKDGKFPTVDFFCDGGFGLLKRLEFEGSEA